VARERFATLILVSIQGSFGFVRYRPASFEVRPIAHSCIVRNKVWLVRQRKVNSKCCLDWRYNTMNRKILMVLMALFATCILVMPAFSIPDDEKPTSEQNCNQIHSMMGDKMPAPECCPCDKPPMGPDGKQLPPMMDGKPAPQGCPSNEPAGGPDGKDGN
jgi:hypothetical protein